MAHKCSVFYLSISLSLPLSLCRFSGNLGHNQLYQHLQSLGHAGSRTAGKEGVRERALCQSLHQDFSLPGVRGGHILPQGERGHPLPGATRVSPWSLAGVFEIEW